MASVLFLGVAPQAYGADSCAIFTSGAQTHGGGSVSIQGGAQVRDGGTSLATTSISDNGNNLSCNTADCTASGTAATSLTFSYPSGINYNQGTVSGSGGSQSTSATHLSSVNISNFTLTFTGDGATRYIQNFTASGTTTINFAPGDYYIQGAFTVADNVTINLTGSGMVRIFTEQTATFAGASNLSSITPARFFVWAKNTIDIQSNATVRGFFYAAEQNANVGNNATVYGGVAGKTSANLQSGATIFTQNSTTLDIADGCAGGGGAPGAGGGGGGMCNFQC